MALFFYLFIYSFLSFFFPFLSFFLYFLTFFIPFYSFIPPLFVASMSVVRMLAWFMRRERWCVGSLYGLSKYQ